MSTTHPQEPPSPPDDRAALKGVRVLLLGSNDRATLGVARSLGRAGATVDVLRLGDRGCSESSRWVGTVHDLGEPTADVAAFLDRLDALLGGASYDLLIPIHDAACELLRVDRPRVEARAAIALPPTPAYRYAHDKEALLELALELGVPVPRSSTLRSVGDLPQLDDTPPDLPRYLKPIHSALVLDNRLLSLRVARAETQRQYVDFCRFHLDRLPVMVQEPVPGKGVGLYLLAREGEILSLVQQERLHEPPGGGGSSYRQTTAIDPVLEAHARRLIQAIGWNGVAMLEFKGRPQSGEWWLMELNGRFWGSLALTLAAGHDLPRWLVQETLRPGSLPSLPEPRIGVRRRHLKKDLGWIAGRLRRGGGAGAVARWAEGFRHLLSGREGFDVESLTDPAPTLADWAGAMGHQAARVRRWLRRRSLLARYRRREADSIARAREILRKPEARVLFLCKGNIGRSAFGEAYWRQRHGRGPVKSAGTLEQHRRLTPSLLARVARQEHGVDLESHRSRPLDSALLAETDLLFAMDSINLEALERFQPITAPVVLLGSSTGQGPIADPYLRPEDEIRATLQQIATAIDGWLEAP